MALSSPPPGTSDIFPGEISEWHALEKAAELIFPLYGYGEIRTPVFEYTEVFSKELGSETEVVQKEMYTFEDRGGRSLTLRPEGTAGIMRALSGTDIMNGVEKRVYYLGPMFRGERPAAGRRRQFHQVGAENAGRKAPELDAECIFMLMHYLEEAGIHGSSLLLSTRASKDDRKPAEERLREYLSGFQERMCEDCKVRIVKNIWRVLDCKQPGCIEFTSQIPNLIEAFGPASREYFDKVCKSLERLGIQFVIEPRLVRGLDYYADTVFEITHPGLGAQNALAGGGRYEITPPGLNKPIGGIGFAAGMERLIMARQNPENPVQEKRQEIFVYLAGMGVEAISQNLPLAAELRKKRIPVISEVENKSLKALLRAANRYCAKFAVIRGDDELAKGSAICKNLGDGEQVEIPIDQLSDFLGNRMKTQ